MRKTRAHRWIAALIAVVIACVAQVAQVRAATCKRAHAYVTGSMAAQERVRDVESRVDVHEYAGVTFSLAAGEPCPSVVAITIVSTPIVHACGERTAARPRAVRAPPHAGSSGLERPPKRA